MCHGEIKKSKQFAFKIGWSLIASTIIRGCIKIILRRCWNGLQQVILTPPIMKHQYQYVGCGNTHSLSDDLYTSTASGLVLKLHKNDTEISCLFSDSLKQKRKWWFLNIQSTTIWSLIGITSALILYLSAVPPEIKCSLPRVAHASIWFIQITFVWKFAATFLGMCGVLGNYHVLLDCGVVCGFPVLCFVDRGWAWSLGGWSSKTWYIPWTSPHSSPDFLCT